MRLIRRDGNAGRAKTSLWQGHRRHQEVHWRPRLLSKPMSKQLFAFQASSHGRYCLGPLWSLPRNATNNTSRRRTEESRRCSLLLESRYQSLVYPLPNYSRLSRPSINITTIACPFSFSFSLETLSLFKAFLNAFRQTGLSVCWTGRFSSYLKAERDQKSHKHIFTDIYEWRGNEGEAAACARERERGRKEGRGVCEIYYHPSSSSIIIIIAREREREREEFFIT